VRTFNRSPQATSFQQFDAFGRDYALVGSRHGKRFFATMSAITRADSEISTLPAVSIKPPSTVPSSRMLASHRSCPLNVARRPITTSIWSGAAGDLVGTS